MEAKAREFRVDREVPHVDRDVQVLGLLVAGAEVGDDAPMRLDGHLLRAARLRPRDLVRALQGLDLDHVREPVRRRHVGLDPEAALAPLHRVAEAEPLARELVELPGVVELPVMHREPRDDLLLRAGPLRDGEVEVERARGQELLDDRLHDVLGQEMAQVLGRAFEPAALDREVEVHAAAVEGERGHRLEAAMRA